MPATTLTSPSEPPLDQKRILRLWWPLAASWLLMGCELLLFTAFVGRMEAPKANLAAFSSIVFPVSLVVEAPIIMLLAASTALCTDWESYRKVRRFMNWAGVGLTVAHIGIAFTPLFDLLARDLIGVPEEVIEPARIGLRIMTPWSYAIAYRRFQQGVLIRFERSRAVVYGTAVRLLANLVVLVPGYLIGTAPGIVVGTSAIAVGVTAEAVFAGWCVRPVLRERVRTAKVQAESLTRSAFLRFYIPLAMTPLLTLLIQPLGAWAMSNLPASIDSLAAWPGVHGLVFLTRSVGFAYNEVVVTLLGLTGAVPALRAFAFRLGATTTAILVLMAATPLGLIWFETVSGLPSDLARISAAAIAFAVLMPAYQALQSWYQGVLVHARSTRGITEAVALYLVVSATGLTLGVMTDPCTGIYYAICIFTLGGVLQTSWLAWSARPHLARLSEGTTRGARPSE